MTLSVIIPVYGVEHTLNRCVESVVRQTFDDWEIILVDDGSLDDSPMNGRHATVAYMSSIRKTAG